MGFVKVNFNGNVRDTTGGTGYVIQSLDNRLLVVGGSRLFVPSIPKIELRVA